MAKRISKFKGPFDTVEDLENRCNLALTDIEGGQLLATKAIGKASEHVTQFTFEENPGEPEADGDVKFKLDNGGENTAWISGVIAKVSFE